jgi:putative addiction module component (TIGR02574 family)
MKCHWRRKLSFTACHIVCTENVLRSNDFARKFHGCALLKYKDIPVDYVFSLYILTDSLEIFGKRKIIKGEVMKKRISVSDVAEFSVAERIQFVEDVWDSIAELPDQVELPEDVKKELDKRLESYHRSPDSGFSMGSG